MATRCGCAGRERCAHRGRVAGLDAHVDDGHLACIDGRDGAREDVRQIGVARDGSEAQGALRLGHLREVDRGVVDPLADPLVRDRTPAHARHALLVHLVVEERVVVGHHHQERDAVVRRGPERRHAHQVVTVPAHRDRQAAGAAQGEEQLVRPVGRLCPDGDAALELGNGAPERLGEVVPALLRTRATVLLTPSIADLMGGQVQYTFDTATATLGQVKAGRLRALAVAANERLSNAPDIPTMAEAGLPGFVGGTWFGLLAPAKTPQPIIDRLNAETRAALSSPELKKAFEDLNINPAADSPAEFRAFINSEITKWRSLAAKVGIKAQ